MDLQIASSTMPIEYLLRKKHFPGVLYEQKTEFVFHVKEIVHIQLN